MPAFQPIEIANRLIPVVPKPIVRLRREYCAAWCARGWLRLCEMCRSNTGHLRIESSILDPARGLDMWRDTQGTTKDASKDSTGLRTAARSFEMIQKAIGISYTLHIALVKPTASAIVWILDSTAVAGRVERSEEGYLHLRGRRLALAKRLKAADGQQLRLILLRTWTHPWLV